MITGELKNKIDQLWEMLWTEGNTNPLTNIEYMIERAKSQLAIQKSLEELETLKKSLMLSIPVKL
ncbi:MULTISPECIES: hypothetical protein [Streptococcus]|uniref:Uncharacterized protein n=1 Tax=Streptococcus oralis subsp. tigurinus TaxID=1077464 RepID=A0A1X1G168_STROR|nr:MULTISPECIES: hypothetical protein [Streptococcus]MBW8202630.1 hypothetical protein [Streptococcus oralis]MCY7079494.1 hypothetical protein [Streptococcus oralis]NIB84164.1 hypothetical protein [Streptococcus sp. CCUG 71758]ORO40520.1 hypothetical protein B7729_02095 [Streptococcus oralis subsp. tigurinus]